MTNLHRAKTLRDTFLHFTAAWPPLLALVWTALVLSLLALLGLERPLALLALAAFLPLLFAGGRYLHRLLDSVESISGRLDGIGERVDRLAAVTAETRDRIPSVPFLSRKDRA